MTCSGRKMDRRENGERFFIEKATVVKQTLRGGKKMNLRQSKFHSEIL
jgi:hypothetical protein